MRNKLVQLCILLSISTAASAQMSMQYLDSLPQLPSRYFTQVDKKLTGLQESIEQKTLKTLRKLQCQEQKLERLLVSKDSMAAKQLFNVQDKYNSFSKALQNPAGKLPFKEYIPDLDSLQTSLKFLKEGSSITDKFSKELKDKIAKTNLNVESLTSRFQQANDVKRFMKERRQQLKVQLEKYGLAKHLKKINKEVYYYQQQLQEYKALLQDKKKLEQRALTALRKVPAFTAFMKKNSQLASLFKLPDNYGTPESLAGLQTRASVQEQIQSRFAGSGVNPQQYIQQQMSQAQGELNKLKDKINKLGGGSSDIDMPDFKPNTQKTKSFLRRIEYGANVQSQKTNGLLPVTSDVALTAGYKLNDKSVIGVGAAYKLGWGKGWEHIKLTHEGIGLRSFVDYKLKGSFWISGGYEQNYQQAFTKIDQLKDFSAWQTSGLIGLTKKYKIGKKTNNLQLLWDFLSYQQVPRKQPVVFRIGYLFK